MTFCILHDDGKALVSTDRRLVKAGERALLEDACAVLARARAIEAEMQTRHAEAERDARQRGLEQGREEGRRAFVGAITQLTRDVREHCLAQEREIAALALAALRRMIDDIGDEAVMAGIARRAVSAVAPGSGIVVEVAPALCEAVTAALGEDRQATVLVRGDAALALHECRIATAEGRIIADLGVQLAAIAERWSMSDVA